MSFIKPEGTLPCSQEPTTGSCPEPHKPSPHLPTLFLYNSFIYYLPIYALIFQVVSSLQVFRTKPFTQFSCLLIPLITCGEELKL